MKCFSSCSTLSHFAINLPLVTAPLQFFLFCVIYVTNCQRRLLSIIYFNWHTSLAALNIFIYLKSIFFGFYFIFLLDWVHYIMTTTLSPRLSQTSTIVRYQRENYLEGTFLLITWIDNYSTISEILQQNLIYLYKDICSTERQFFYYKKHEPWNCRALTTSIMTTYETTFNNTFGEHTAQR